MLDRIASQRGLPEAVALDEGPEFRGHWRWRAEANQLQNIDLHCDMDPGPRGCCLVFRRGNPDAYQCDHPLLQAGRDL